MATSFCDQVVEAVDERGHVLAVHARHALETPRAVRVPIALADARTAQPLDFGLMGRASEHIGEIGLRLDIAALARLGGKTLEERSHILPLDRVHAAERARTVLLLPTLGDARMRQPQDVLAMRRVLIALVVSRARDITEPFAVSGRRLPRRRVRDTPLDRLTTQERRHVLTVHARHALEPVRAIRVLVPFRNLVGREPLDIIRMRRPRIHIRKRNRTPRTLRLRSK